MSSEEDPELRDLVAQTLENNGVLSKIRAQLRASVFLALEEQEMVQNKIPFINKSLQEFLKTSEGSLVTCLVHEFLEYFELDFTLSVFDPETFHGKDYDYGGRNKLIKDLKLKNLNGKKGPLLAQILQLVQVPQKDCSATFVKEESNNYMGTEELFSSFENKPLTSGDHLPRSLLDVSVDEKLSNLWTTSEKVTVADSVKKSSLKLDGGGDSANTKQISSGESRTQPSLSKTNKEKKANESKSPTFQSEPSHSSLTSLGNLPPLLGANKTPADTTSFDVNKEKDIGHLKALINGIDVNEPNYDEDFHSSASGSAVDVKVGGHGSDSEDIEEDFGSGMDDLLSNASGLEDLTVDATVSNLSGIGDYMENL